MVKQCTRCGLTKPLDGFVKDPAKRDGRSSYCRGCHSARVSAARAAMPEKIREQRKTWNQNRKDEDSAWKRADLVSNPGKYWAKHLNDAHGMQPEQWYAMFAEQEGRCYLCEQPLPEGRSNKVAVDHDHGHCPPGSSCGVCRRGLAHSNCNTGIGLLGDNPALLRLVADNLERAQAITAALTMAAPVQMELIELDGTA